MNGELSEKSGESVVQRFVGRAVQFWAIKVVEGSAAPATDTPGKSPI